jgi:hypothetical protein
MQEMHRIMVRLLYDRRNTDLRNSTGQIIASRLSFDCKSWHLVACSELTEFYSSRLSLT